MISQVANRYAEALFELAVEEKIESDIFSEIKEVEEVICENRELFDVLKSPLVDKNDKKNIAKEVFSGSISNYILNFVYVLIDNRRTTEISSIVEAYKDMLNTKNNVSEGVVITAVPLSEEKIAILEEKISAKYNKSIKLVNKIDENVIGGVLVKIGNEEIDGTVKTRLDSLKGVLSKVIS